MYSLIQGMMQLLRLIINKGITMFTIKNWWVLLVPLAALALMYMLTDILMPFLVAMLLAYMGDPIVDKLETKTNRTLAVSISFSVIFLILILLSVLLVPLLVRQLEELIQLVPTILAWMQEVAFPFIASKTSLDPATLNWSSVSAELDWGQTSGIVGKVLKGLSNSTLSILALVGNLFLIPVVTFYMLRDWDILVARVSELVPRKYVASTKQVAIECHQTLGAFLKGQLLVMLALSIIYGFGLMLVGLKLGLLIGVLAGLAAIVPYMGIIVGLGAALIAAFFQFDSFTPLLWVIAVFVIGQMLEGMLLTPLLVGDKIGLHPVAVIFAVLAGGQLVGFVGILLALPVAAVVMVLLRRWHVNYRASQIYSAEKPMNDDEQAFVKSTGSEVEENKNDEASSEG